MASGKCEQGRFNSVSATIDVVADVKPERWFVVLLYAKAAGVQRHRGQGSYLLRFMIDQVNWVPGDVFYVNWDDVLVGATAVVSTIGDAKDQWDANVVAVNAAKDYGVPKFILISVHNYNLPPFLLSSGYFTGKRKAESEVLSKYPNSGIVLRPGFIYGKRRVDGFELPLDLIGEPVERIMSATENFTKPLSSLPASDLLLAPPVSVDDVALAVINGIRDDDFFGIFTIAQIKEAADKVSNANRSECHRTPGSATPCWEDEDKFGSAVVFPYNWDFGFRRNLNERELAEVIKMLDILDGIRLSPSRLDRRLCELEGSGSFSCKSFRSFLLNNGMAEAFSPYSLIWKAKSHPKSLVDLVEGGQDCSGARIIFEI
ncbi:Ribonuclease H-like superfamily protein [Prunus dulcis]|uniref:Ribonuclease H-like superfamily protein n=1 Tax=Prunus dulcis TaxID=3755 RepID=A0A4Y1RFJ2_PRUDU|nr:Ribonuclease H-like superfamily protein [Prunus dulcis]